VLQLPFRVASRFWEVVEKSSCVVKSTTSGTWGTQWLYTVDSVNERNGISALERRADALGVISGGRAWGVVDA
jgi:hypothetical protein